MILRCRYIGSVADNQVGSYRLLLPGVGPSEGRVGKADAPTIPAIEQGQGFDDREAFTICKRCAVCRYQPTLLAKLASVHVHEYGSDDFVKTSSGIDLVIR